MHLKQCTRRHHQHPVQAGPRVSCRLRHQYRQLGARSCSWLVSHRPASLIVPPESMQSGAQAKSELPAEAVVERWRAAACRLEGPQSVEAWWLTVGSRVLCGAVWFVLLRSVAKQAACLTPQPLCMHPRHRSWRACGGTPSAHGPHFAAPAAGGRCLLGPPQRQLTWRHRSRAAPGSTRIGAHADVGGGSSGGGDLCRVCTPGGRVSGGHWARPCSSHWFILGSSKASRVGLPKCEEIVPQPVTLIKQPCKPRLA